MADDKENKEKTAASMKRYVYIFTVFIVVVAILLVVYWFVWGRYRDNTDDAYVHGNIVTISTQVPGIVSSINADNMQYVKEGQVLIELDRTDSLIALEKAEAELGEVVRQVSKMFQEVYQRKADLEMSKAHLIRTEIDYQNRKDLVGEGAVSKEDYIHSKLAYESAIANVESQRSQLKQAYALVQNATVATHPLVLEAANQVKKAYVNLNRCQILCPADGIVSQRGAQVGTYAQVEEELMAIVPLDQIWAQANFREVDLSQIRIGQRVKVTSDMYGSDVVYNGYVTGIDGGTGSVFSLIPPQNATGNWIKIVQRVPVRVDFDKNEIARYPLRLGLSLNVAVDTHDQYGPRIPKDIGDKPIFETDVYEDQERGVNELIHSIIEKNASYYLNETIQIDILIEEE